MPITGIRRAVLLAGTAIATAAAPAAFAQDRPSAGNATEVIVITATKRAGGMDVQDVGAAVTAYGTDQLDARFVRNLESLSFAMPNVQLNDVGTAKGIANFSIRGVGINSSIPSVDPTVGVFVDGMYLGINAGVVLDTFDLDGVEVLRGPQGLLFGRNVTGGAVLLRTRAPDTEEFSVDGKVAVESGLNYYAMGTASGPITDTVALKLAAYYNQDEGWFNNQFDNNEDFGASETWVVRPAISLDVTDSIDTILRLEHGDTEGDGPPGQNHAVFDDDSFGFSVNFPGYANSDWDQAIWETNWRVGFGDGTVTNILGWREYSAETGNDIDSLPLSMFHARTMTDQDQISNELRYSGTLEDAVDLTAGLYYFQQSTAYTEERVLFGSIPSLRTGPLAAQGGRVTGGGEQDHTTWGAFSQFDMHFTPTFTFNAGVRYTYEEKDASIVPLAAGLALPVNAQPCSIDLGGCSFNPAFSFINSDEWSNVDGKLGFQWEPTDDVQFYGFWTSGFRSGGYNFRVSPTLQPGFNTAPGPTEPESVDAYEAGVKYDDPNGRYRINTAFFYTEIDDMQRELNLPGQLGVAQFIRNTADATIKGFEVEGQMNLTDSLFLTGFAGYTDGEYDKVLLDLSCTGLTVCQPTGGPEDLALEIPRLAPWSYGIGANYVLGLGGFGTLTSRVDWSHRDLNYYTDNNLGILNEADMLDASFGFSPQATESWVFSIYGRNLLSEATHGGDTQLPPNLFPGPVPGVPFAGPFGGPGASFSPLNKGTVIGAEAQFRF